MDDSGNLTTLHSFDDQEGAFPNALLQATDGDFYGTAPQGGKNDYGTFFRMNSSAVVTVLDHFTAEEGRPFSLIQGSDGYFYGTGYAESGSVTGLVFRFDDEGSLTPIHEFTEAEGKCARRGARRSRRW